MEKYFKSEKTKEILLSDYLKKDSTDFEKCTFSEEARIRRTKYLMDVLGDVSFDRDTYETFISEFQCFGGRYDVRTKPDTIKGVYGITRKYPILTQKAIVEIWFRYITDLFKEYDLESVLDKYIQTYGVKDETFELFIGFVEEVAEQHQQKYKDEAKQAEKLEEYSEDFRSHIKSLITRRHFTLDEIKKCLPSASLIKKDEEHISDISRRTRIFFGCCLPVSYTMVDILLESKSLDTFTETPTYYISTGREEQATFTKQEFLDSIQKAKEKKLEK